MSAREYLTAQRHSLRTIIYGTTTQESHMHRILFVAAFAVTSSVASAQAVPVTLSEWKVELGRDTVKAGAVTFRIKNTGTMTHGFYVTGPGVDKGAKDIPAGQEAPFTLTLKPGTYEVYCPLADLTHKAAGMTHKLTVIPGDAAPTKKPGEE
jgi:uncharacterized cupredoxin-like copper-binding protein